MTVPRDPITDALGLARELHEPDPRNPGICGLCGAGDGGYPCLTLEHIDAAIAAHRKQAERIAALEQEREQLAALLPCLVDDEVCWFDHHGGCQAHCYLSLQPGEKCPQQELKEVIADLERP